MNHNNVQSVSETLSLWLAQGALKSPSDPLAGAIKIGLDARDANIKALQSQTRAFLKLQPSDDSTEAQALREKLGPGRNHRVNDFPEVEALRALIEPGGNHAGLLDRLVVQELTMASFHSRKAADSRNDPAKASHHAREAEEQRQYGLDMTQRHRERLRAEGSQPRETGQPAQPRRSRSSKPKPMNARTLQKLAQQFYEDVHTALANAVRVGPSTPNSPLPDPHEAARKVLPAVRFDQETLLQAGCEQLLILAIDTGEDNTALREADVYTQENLTRIIQRQAESITREADRLRRAISSEYGWSHDDLSQEEMYPEVPLRDLWELANPGQEMDPGWLLLVGGPAGQEARTDAAANALASRQAAEDEREEAAGLSLEQRAERRASYAYSGPPLDWSLEKLQTVWNGAHPGEPLPRRWRALAPGVPTHARDSARLESYHLKLYKEKYNQLQEAIANVMSLQTQRRRQREAYEALQQYLEAAEHTARCLSEAGIEPPPPEQHPPLPAIPADERPRGTSLNQQALAMTGVQAVPRPQRPRQPAPGPRLKAQTAQPQPMLI